MCDEEGGGTLTWNICKLEHTLHYTTNLPVVHPSEMRVHDYIDVLHQYRLSPAWEERAGMEGKDGGWGEEERGGGKEVCTLYYIINVHQTLR